MKIVVTYQGRSRTFRVGPYTTIYAFAQRVAAYFGLTYSQLRMVERIARRALR
jgi:hypothetical protein